ncbi:Carboxypeptidase regulatory-like domain protein [Marine Group I thaumarchaeote SCGC AAA799-E16]|uniref:Carboxypeptidase regulatory-like domain protein n=1 Tax=Marine Group I thaumarchaeote SCGC AAA799-E16 TaxID=1502292 RepID=A0A081S4R4_9ARCH|nr:Carboxypeptidase regulatory-like domain protein [Marine Group I thaumarchaeote SCGC AAA799-E16]
MYKKVGIVGIFSFLMLFSAIQTSDAELWELIIDLNVEKGAIVSGETLVVTGKVVDHAYKPIRGAEVLIRTGSETTKAFTTPEGTFKGEFKNFDRVPGTYTINVIATWYGMTGLETTQVQVKGDASPVSLLQQKLDTEEARKYLSSEESDFEKDPIGQTLFKYYHGLLQELIFNSS